MATNPGSDQAPFAYPEEFRQQKVVADMMRLRAWVDTLDHARLLRLTLDEAKATANAFLDSYIRAFDSITQARRTFSINDFERLENVVGSFQEGAYSLIVKMKSGKSLLVADFSFAEPLFAFARGIRNRIAWKERFVDLWEKNKSKAVAIIFFWSWAPRSA